MNKMWDCPKCGHYCAEETCCHCLEAVLHPPRDPVRRGARKDPSSKHAKVRRLSKAKGNTSRVNPRWITATKGVTSMVMNPVGNGKRP